MAFNFTNTFTELGLIFGIQEAINLSRGTTIPPKVKTLIDQFNSSSLDFREAIDGAEGLRSAYQSGASGAMSTLRQIATNILIEHAEAEATNPLPQRDLQRAIEALIFDMVAGSQSVDAPTVAVSAGANSGNGDGVMVVSAKRNDGLSLENILAETILAQCTDDSAPATASFTPKADVAIQDQLSSDWPGGSGASTAIVAVSGNSSLLTNGDFDDEDDVANTPDDWIVSVGTIGTTIKMTDYEVQRIVVTGPPTAGTWTITWNDANGDKQTTIPLAYDASGSAVQSALRLLKGLELVTVSTTGTSPLFTHDITFTGVAGNLNQITIANNTTGGTYTPSTVTGGSANAFLGKAVEFDSNGADSICIQQPITLLPLRQYAFCIWMLADVVPAAGVITVSLVDSTSTSNGATVLNDQAGTANSFTINCAALTTSFVAKTGVFRTPKVLPTNVFLRIQISTPISAGTSVFLDHAALALMTELYPGGPHVAIFSGKTAFKKGGAQTNPDYFTITVTNNGAGEFQTWFERNFLMRQKGLQLPSNSAGAETIDDALVV